MNVPRALAIVGFICLLVGATAAIWALAPEPTIDKSTSKLDATYNQAAADDQFRVHLGVSRDMIPEGNAGLGNPAQRWSSLFLNGTIQFNQNLTFYGPNGPTMILRPDGSIELLGQLQTLNATAENATYPFDQPDSGVACWDRNGDGEANDDEDLNGDGKFDVGDCIGEDGEEGPRGPRGIRISAVGPPGPPGPPGTDGIEAAVLLYREDPAAPGCGASGGVTAMFGLDDGNPAGTAKNFILEATEVDWSFEVCDGDSTGSVGPAGIPGDRGPDAYRYLAQASSDGGQCPHGGLRQQTGLDSTGGFGGAPDGILSASETSPEQTAVVCNGAQGDEGPPGPDATGKFKGPPGDNGDPGGEGPIGPQGKRGPRGAFGMHLLTRTDDEPAGANCALGGRKISFGFDDGTPAGLAGDGILQEGEVEPDGIVYACRGEEGPVASDTLKFERTVPRGSIQQTDLSGTDSQLSMTLNERGWPVMIYRKSSGDVYVRTCDDAACETGFDDRRVGPPTASALNSDLAVRVMPDGNPVAIIGDSNKIWLTICHDSKCTTSTNNFLANNLGTGRETLDLIIDAQGCWAVAYYNSGNGLSYIRGDPSSDCQGAIQESISQLGGTIFGRSVIAVVGWDGLPRFVVERIQGTQYEPTFIRCSQPTCQGAETLKPFFASAREFVPMDMAIAPGGTPMVLLEDEGNEELHAVLCSDPDCLGTQTAVHVLPGLQFADAASLSFGDEELPMIALHDEANGQVVFAKCHVADCSEATARYNLLGDGVGLQLAMAYDGLPLIGYADATESATLKLASPYGPDYWHRRS